MVSSPAAALLAAGNIVAVGPPFEPSMPNIGSPIVGDIVHGDGLGEATHAAYLDVQDATAAELQRRLGVAAVADALV